MRALLQRVREASVTVDGRTVGVEEREVHLPGGVLEDAEAGDAVRKRDCLGIAVAAAHTEQDEEPGADGADLPPLDRDRRLANALEEGSHLGAGHPTATAGREHRRGMDIRGSPWFKGSRPGSGLRYADRAFYRPLVPQEVLTCTVPSVSSG